MVFLLIVCGFVLWPLALGIWFSGRWVAMWVCYYLVLPGLICFNSVVFLFMFVVETGWLGVVYLFDLFWCVVNCLLFAGIVVWFCVFVGMCLLPGCWWFAIGFGLGGGLVADLEFALFATVCWLFVLITLTW